ncbi:MAG: SdrD B-like domain-containing protein, partial [Planctomycetota bacterium]
DAAGDFVWAKQFASVGFVYGQDVEVASDGSIFVMGLFPSSVDVDPGPDTFILDTTGGYDTFVSKFDSAANLQWVQTFGANAAYDIVLAPDGSVHTAGALAEINTDFDPRGGQHLLSATSSDIFVALHRPPSAPTGITLPANRVFEYQPIGTVVGGLIGIDPDAKELFDFALVPGTGDTDNAFFTIEGGVLVTAAEFDAAVRDTYSIRVQATDLSGLKVQAPLTVRVVPISDVATISGQLWMDINSDGLRQDDEPPVADAVAELRTAADQVPRDSVVIGADGQYTFTGVIPSVDYTVAFRVPVGYDYTVTDAGADDAIDSDADAMGVTQAYSPTPGQTLGGVDAGVVGTLPAFGFALGIGSDENDEGRVVGTDAAGNVYMTGTFRGTADFDPGSGETLLHGVSNSDVFIAKYTRLGVLVWAKEIAGQNYLYSRGMAVSDAGELTVTASYSGTVDVDPGPGELLFDSPSGASLVVRLGNDGELVWAKSLAAGNPKGVVIDGDSAVYLTGGFSGTGDFDPGPGTFNLTSAGDSDIFVAKLDETGALVWAKAYGGSNNEFPERIALSASGNVYLIGQSDGTADYDPGPCAVSLTTSVFLLRLEDDGDLMWARGFEGYGRALAVSGDGGVFGSGLLAGTNDFDPGLEEFLLQSQGSYDIPVYHLDPEGNFEWAVQLGGTAWDQASDLSFDPDGNLVGVGAFNDVADFDPGPTENLLTSAGDYDIVVFRLDAAGAGISADRFGGPGYDVAYGLHVSADGSEFVTGLFSDTADFDPGAGVFALTSS